jgi:SSS family solute:Na+ symporter
MDIYKKLNPKANEKKLILVGRIATGIIVITGVLWIPLMKVVSSGGIYKYLQSVQAYIAPPIAAVFLLGLFWSRINSQGALAALIGGFSAGMLRLGLEINKSNLSGFWFDFADLNFLYFAIFSFLSCIVIMIIVSMMTPKPNQEQLDGLTYNTTTESDKEITNNSWNTFDVVNSVIIIGILGLILIYFSPLGIGG